MPSREAYLRDWSRLHGGVDPGSSLLVRGWLALVYSLARPLAARGAPPDLLTVAGLLAAGLVVGLTALGGRWLIAAAAAVAVSGLLDGLDGAVAVLAGRVSAFGSVLDSLVDRCSDLLYLAALAVAGADPRVCVVGGVVTLLHEYARARATAVGLPDVGVVTVSERPTRLAVAAAFLLAAGLLPASATWWAQAGALAWVAVGLLGLAQLIVMLRRRLR